jgi:N-acetylated-alpha-linked acidic dipeptidase
MTLQPHVAGTKEDYATAQYVQKRFAEYGLETEVVEYRVLLPYPKEVKLELISPTPYTAKIREAAIAVDPDSSNPNIILPYNAYSPSGDVTGDLVYVNYGLPGDYEELAKAGVDVKGKIALVRYGGAFRGVKSRLAADHGAIGCIIYSDPNDDGFVRGKVIPEGPYRPPTGVQRGSILDGVGDPLTPGWAATKDAKRLEISEVQGLPKIPTTPISYADAEPLLHALAGQKVPANWQGGLAFDYHFGPGPAKVHLKLTMDFQVRPIWDVIGKIQGSVEPDKLVILGGHRDAWDAGAADNVSGTVSVMEVARALGQAVKHGFRPKRTIVFATWDAEEFGLIGSTEWAEEHEELLTKNCVAYLNLDVAATGNNFNASASPTIKQLFREATMDVKDPQTGKSVYDQWREAQHLASKDDEVTLGDLGGGSDFAGFINHLGITSSEHGFGGGGGVYHSAYDDYYYMTHFGDPGFKYHAAAAQVIGIVALRLSNAEVLPFDYEEYGIEIINALTATRKSLGDNNPKLGAIIDDALESAAALRLAGGGLNLQRDRVGTSSGLRNPDKATAEINRMFMQAERDLTSKQGLPGRSWYRHLIYAPGVNAGYGVTVLPGINEAVADKDWKLAQEQAYALKTAIDRAAQTLRSVRF